MISSGKSFTKGHQFRNAFKQRQIPKNPWIDFFGRQFKPFKTKEEPLANYIFSITLENEAYSNYFTEKLIHCFANVTTYIYHGTPKFGVIFNPNGAIVLTENFDPNSLDKDLYFSKLEAIQDHFELCLSHKKDGVLYDLILEDIG